MKEPKDITHMFNFLSNGSDLLIGVYGLWLDDILKYIGETKRLIPRIKDHWVGLSTGVDPETSLAAQVRRQRRIEELQHGFDKVTFWECRNRFEALVLEKFLIYTLKPLVNKPYHIPLKYKTEYDKILYIMKDMKTSRHNGIWSDVNINDYLPFKRRI